MDCTHPFDSDDDNDPESSWDPHAGTHPSPLDGDASDGEIEFKEVMVHGDAVRLRQNLVSMLDELGDLNENDPRDEDWLPADKE